MKIKIYLFLTSLISSILSVSSKSAADYRIISPLGAGAQGTVSLVEERETGLLFAMKRVSKAYIHHQKFYSNLQIERDILTNNRSPWLGRAYHTFQDDFYLYFIMEYTPGGDLMSIFMHHEILPEDSVKFYIAELVQSLELLHSRGYIHRDLKPENILVNGEGHMSLTDFGMATSVWESKYDPDYFLDMMERQYIRYERRISDRSADENPIPARPSMGKHKRSQTSIPRLESPRLAMTRHRRRFFSMVGTIDYIAPEILQAGNGYTSLCDSWSLGAIMYEMLFGETPFSSDTQVETVSKILNWKYNLRYRPIIGYPVSDAAVSFMRSLLCDEKDRMSPGQMKNHPFLRDVNFSALRNYAPPYVPVIEHATDVRNFPIEDLSRVLPQSVPVIETPEIDKEVFNAPFKDFDYETF